jgi:hypothetical protein
MLRLLFRSYKPQIQFRKGGLAPSQPEIRAQPVSDEYGTPLYLSFRPAPDSEELDVINSGGIPPKVHWSKVSLANKK